MNEMSQDVKQAVYQAVADAAGADFAFSYLVMAKQRGTIITPHTWTAWDRLRNNRNAMVALHGAGVTLKEPIPWSPHRDQPVRQAA